MTKILSIEADTVEELCTEFVRAMARIAPVSVQPSKGGKPYGKVIMAGGGIGGFQPSYNIPWPEGILIEGKVPTECNLTVQFGNLVAPAARKVAEKQQAATITTDITNLFARAKRLGVSVEDLVRKELAELEANSAGE